MNNSSDRLLEPDDVNNNNNNKMNELTKIMILLFNIQTKFNNEVYKKLYPLIEIDSKKTDINTILLTELNNKIDKYLFYSSIGIGLSLGTLCYVTIFRT
jgi:hypothetical protein